MPARGDDVEAEAGTPTVLRVSRNTVAGAAIWSLCPRGTLPPLAYRRAVPAGALLGIRPRADRGSNICVAGRRQLPLGPGIVAVVAGLMELPDSFGRVVSAQEAESTWQAATCRRE